MHDFQILLLKSKSMKKKKNKKKTGRTREEVIQLKLPISLKLAKNVGFEE